MARILVVEDEPALALGLEDDLKLEGYEVEVVRDGETASRRAREQSFDLIILDVMLPHKDGFEVCRELRRAGLRTPRSEERRVGKEGRSRVGRGEGREE